MARCAAEGGRVAAQVLLHRLAPRHRLDHGTTRSPGGVERARCHVPCVWPRWKKEKKVKKAQIRRSRFYAIAIVIIVVIDLLAIPIEGGGAVREPEPCRARRASRP